MLSPVPYHEGVETLADDEAETHRKIIDIMTHGMDQVQEKTGKAVRISHAKAHGLLKGQLIVDSDLPPELAQGLFVEAKSYPVIVRLATIPGEFTDDSKLSTVRGMSLKVLDVAGLKLSPFETTTTQDFLMDTGKEFFTTTGKTFLQVFKPNTSIAPKLSDTVKGVVSEVARGTNAALNAVGLNSGTLDAYGHEKNHPLVEEYYTQTPYRYGDYIAKLGVRPTSQILDTIPNRKIEPETPNALREITVAYFQTNPAEFEVVVQLNTDLEKMPVEDAMAKWPEELSPFRRVARLVIPAQEAFSPGREEYVEDELSFCPAHSLVAHRPLGSVNRARMVVYETMSNLRRRRNGCPVGEPTSIESMPA